MITWLLCRIFGHVVDELEERPVCARCYKTITTR